MARPDDDLPIDDDILSLHGVTVPTTQADPVPHAEPSEEESPPTLILRPWDDEPTRDFQPRLFRFGEAA